MDQDQPIVDEIFLAALERTTAEARAAFLDEVCHGDRTLRDRVERLLSAQPKVAHFLEAPAPGLSVTLNETVVQRPGTQIGPYRLVEQIGERGHGRRVRGVAAGASATHRGLEDH